MAQGLRPHHHEYYEHRVDKYYDNQKCCMVKNISYRCMICGKIYHERYEYKPPPVLSKVNKVLEKNKKKRGKIWKLNVSLMNTLTEN